MIAFPAASRRSVRCDVRLNPLREIIAWKREFAKNYRAFVVKTGWLSRADRAIGGMAVGVVGIGRVMTYMGRVWQGVRIA